MSADPSGKSKRHFPLSLFALALIIGIAVTARAQTFKITDVRIGPDGRIVLQHTADTNSYYILLRGDQVTAILTAKDMQLGKVGTNQLKDPNLAANAGFYRVRQVALSSPLDTDGDGIDDVFELKYRPQLNPLNASDAGLDPDGDGRTTLEEYHAGRNPFVADLPEVTTISYPTNATTASFVIFSGVATTNTLIRVEGGAAYVTNAVGAGGVFEVTVALNPNRLNRLFVSAVDEFGNVSPPVPIDILQDSVAPYLFIDFPTNGIVLTTSNTLVAGRVGDALSGFLGLGVTVNGVAANVDVGIGPNGTYQRGLVPLNMGTNELTVVAMDRVGNSITRRVTVTREVPAGPRLLAISGDLQQTNILKRLVAPLFIKVTEAGGAPRANQLVNFQVTRSDGRLLPVNTNQLASEIISHADYTTNGTMSVQLLTDANGEAKAWWTMGMDAGHANNRVTVSASNIQETVYFCASATALPAKQINIGSGNNQRGETLGPAPEPLKVWVSDGNNPVAGVPVTFRVVQGSGELVPIVAADGASPAGPGLRASRPTGSITLKRTRRKDAQASEVTVLTSMTGHAEVDFIFGAESGTQMVEATFTGNTGLPATFTAQVLARVPGQPTSFIGLIRDNALQPIGRAYCELTVAGATVTAFSDTQGRFAFANIPSGTGHLYVNGGTAITLGTNTIPSNSFPALQYTIAVVPNAENSLSTPVLLPRLNTNNAQWYYGTNDLVVTCQGIAGLKMTIKANSMKHPGGEIVSPGRPAFVSLNQVHHDKIPMPMPDGASPPFAWTLQPGGATFDPPVQVEYPNMSGLAPGAAAFFLTFNHDTERFEIVASGHVVQDGSKIVCDPGAGLTISGWGGGCPPYPITADVEQCEEVPAQPALFKTKVAKAGDATSSSDVKFINNNVPIHLASLLDPFCGITEVDSKEMGSTIVCRSDGRFIVNLTWTLTIKSIEVWDKITDPDDIDFILQHERKHIENWRQRVEAAKVYAHQNFDGRTYPTRGAASAAKNDFESQIILQRELERSINDQDIDTEADSTRCGVIRETYEGPVPGLVGRAKSQRSCCGHDVIVQELPSDSWTFTVNGQSVTTSSDRSFRIPNVSAPDNFGADGPGSPPDNESDDYVRLLGVGVIDGTNRYASSDYFRMRQGEKISVPNLQFNDSPRQQPESLRAVPDALVLTNAGQMTQVRVSAIYADGTTESRSGPAQGTSYRISNPRIATVDANGVVTAVGPGTVFITAVNEGASSVAELIVAPSNAILITVAGRLVDTNGLPVAGVGVTVRAGELDFSSTTGADGAFAVGGVLTTFGPVSITAIRQTSVGRLFAMLREITPGPGGVTTVEDLVLLPFLPRENRDFAAGYRHSVAIKTDGSIWSWGYNGSGQLGIGSVVDQQAPTQIGLDTNWQAVDAGDYHTVAIRADGSMWAWGDNGWGELGIGSFEWQVSPTQIGTETDWKAAACGSDFTVALKTDGSIWTWGNNCCGQLGDGTSENANAPRRMDSATNWQAISCASAHTLALKTDGSLWGWGDNSSGELGIGAVTRTNRPTRIGSDTNWLLVACGGNHTMALKTDGQLWAWGLNSQGALGNGTLIDTRVPSPIGTAKDWASLAGGNSFAVALKLDGSLWAWGYNGYGQLGDGTTTRTNRPIRIGTATDWRAAKAGGGHTMALKNDGGLWTWGDNQWGQSGNGTTRTIVVPEPVGSDADWEAVTSGYLHNAALKTDGSLWAWGYNNTGQLGDGTVRNKSVPTRIGASTNWRAVASCGSHTLAIRTDGRLWAWGANSLGQLGIGTFTFFTNEPVQVGTNANWQSLAGGHNSAHSVARRNDGSLWAWGINSDGQLGNGTFTRTNVPTQVGTDTNWLAAACGASHSVALKADGSLWAWGDNAWGQLGIGVGDRTNAPVQIGTDTDWQAVACGEKHTMAIKIDGSLWGWGTGPLGDETIGAIRFTNAPMRIGMDTNWQAVAGGAAHAVGVRADGSLWAWGYNGSGQLGNGTFNDIITPTRIGTDSDWQAVACGNRHTVARKVDGRLFSWGDNEFGQTAQPVPWQPHPVIGTNDWRISP